MGGDATHPSLSAAISFEVAIVIGAWLLISFITSISAFRMQYAKVRLLHRSQRWIKVAKILLATTRLKPSFSIMKPYFKSCLENLPMEL